LKKHIFVGKRPYYLALFFVVLVWGLDPIIMSRFYDYYSASVLTAIGTGTSLLLLLVYNARRLRDLTARYFKIAAPISALNSAACLLQKIGLQYTTPANYAFLEHLSCVVVPLMLFILVKKRPSLPQAISAVLCLGGCFILCGVGTAGATSLAFGDILCALAGVMLGVCVALTGVFGKGLDMSLYMLVHMGVYFIISVCSTIALNLIPLGGTVAEPILFTFDLGLLVLAALFGLLSIGLCWLLKNTATVRLDPTVVAVISPFAAVISAIASVLVGEDTLHYNLVIGGVLILAAVLFSDIKVPTRRREGPPNP
jgi:drug/metabolite transporter (DMT)-like permease